MADDLAKSGGQDRKRIDINQSDELRDWAKKFGVSPERLKTAVGAVGSKASDVEERLKGGRKAAKRASTSNTSAERPGR